MLTRVKTPVIIGKYKYDDCFVEIIREAEGPAGEEKVSSYLYKPANGNRMLVAAIPATEDEEADLGILTADFEENAETYLGNYREDFED